MVHLSSALLVVFFFITYNSWLVNSFIVVAASIRLTTKIQQKQQRRPSSVYLLSKKMSSSSTNELSTAKDQEEDNNNNINNNKNNNNSNNNNKINDDKELFNDQFQTTTTTTTKQPTTWNPLRLLVLKLGFTEPPMISPFNYGSYDGIFYCAYCGSKLFDSNSKYDSGSGWPSFWRSINDDAIDYKKELDGRLECHCKNCSSHLGHVFLDGPLPNNVSKELLSSSPKSDPRSRSGKYLPRFCINGASMKFHARETDAKN